MKQVNELLVTNFNEDRITDRNQSRGGLESLHLPFVLLCLSSLAEQNNKNKRLLVMILSDTLFI